MSKAMLNVYLLRVARHLLTPEGADAAGYSEWTMPRGYVVLAQSETEARDTAARAPEGHVWKESGEWWTDPKSSTCELVSLDGDPRIVMADEPTG